MTAFLNPSFLGLLPPHSSLKQYFFLSIALFLLNLPISGYADVVKPALVEISTLTSGRVEIEIRASLEALLTGINGKYKNTKEAPNAEEYDVLRALDSHKLGEAFKDFKPSLLSEIALTTNGNRVNLDYESISIPEPGYTKVPRISIITLSGQLSRENTQVEWYYPAKMGDNAVRVRQVDETNEKWHWSQWQWLREDSASTPFSLTELFTRQPTSEVIVSYIKIGFDHIIPKGLDHILFILGIFLLSTRIRPLLGQVTMFTIAHTITLGLSMNGLIELSPRIVEPLIALSIAYVGIENVFAKNLHNSRLLLVFVFGLLHGLGFAGVLSDFGMPKDDFATALVSFNIGVELGQIAVIALAYIGLAMWFKSRDTYRNFVTIPASLAISAIGLYWTLERLEWIA